jgi:hypothetical protein
MSFCSSSIRAATTESARHRQPGPNAFARRDLRPGRPCGSSRLNPAGGAAGRRPVRNRLPGCAGVCGYDPTRAAAGPSPGLRGRKVSRRLGQRGPLHPGESHHPSPDRAAAQLGDSQRQRRHAPVSLLLSAARGAVALACGRKFSGPGQLSRRSPVGILPGGMFSIALHSTSAPELLPRRTAAAQATVSWGMANGSKRRATGVIRGRRPEGQP